MERGEAPWPQSRSCQRHLEDGELTGHVDTASDPLSLPAVDTHAKDTGVPGTVTTVTSQANADDLKPGEHQGSYGENEIVGG